MKIKLNCLGCGFPMDLGEAYEDYQGEIRCWGCHTVLEVTMREGKLMAMRRLGAGTAAAAGETR
jgi:hypothetical protein